MKKKPKKLTLNRETVCALVELRRVEGGVVKTVDATYCVTNCRTCETELPCA